MPHTLFDLQRDASPGRFDRANEQLQAYRSDYIERFGRIGTDTWWRNYHSGFVSKDIQVGFVMHLGEHAEWGEDPVVVIRTDRRDHAYDLDGFWLTSSVRLNVWIRIERFKICIPPPTGDMTELIDAHIEVLESEPQRTQAKKSVADNHRSFVA